MLNNLRNFKYLKKNIILLMDVALSALATLCAYLSMSSVVKNLEGTNLLLTIVLTSAISSLILFFASNLHRDTIRHFAVANILKITIVAFVKEVVVMLMVFFIVGLSTNVLLFLGAVDFLLTSSLLVGMRSAMVAAYYYLIDKVREDVKDAFIYSTSGTNPDLVQQINKDTNSKYRIRGFLSTNDNIVGIRISGEKVYAVNQSDEELDNVFRSCNIRTVIFTSQESIKKERDHLVEYCIKKGISMLALGDVQELDEKGNIPNRYIKPIQIEDLLERQEINIEIDKISAEIKGKVVMVTGAAGSIGSEISRQVATFGVKKLVLYDVAETPMHNIQLEFTKNYPNVDIEYVLADVRSTHRAKKIVSRYKPSIIFHAAAYKHVPMIEANPCEGVIANVWGTVNMAQRAMENGVEKFVMVSTDKAVNPTNIMGATKRIAEMCVQSMNRLNKTAFVTTRFGNVLGSNGSVIPYFKKQIAAGGPITVTHPDIIRYFMTIPEACRLVLQAATMGYAGQILVFDMGEQVKIVELAKKMIRLSGFELEKDIKIEFTGLRPGEKLYEELLSNDENTEATQNKKIRIAQSVVLEKDTLDALIKKLIVAARNVEIDNTVMLMKEIVPEFKSKNSEFERFDK